MLLTIGAAESKRWRAFASAIGFERDFVAHARNLFEQAFEFLRRSIGTECGADTQRATQHPHIGG